MSSTASPRRPPTASSGGSPRLSPLFMLCVAAMGGAYVAGERARMTAVPAFASASVSVAAPDPAAVALSPAPLRGALSDARDLECLTQAVYYEARGEPESGQAAVAEVVLNRTRAGRYPTSVCGVVFQHARVAQGRACQFSFACDRRIARPRERAAWVRAERVARAALAGRRAAALPASTTQFRVAGLSSEGLEQVARIGAHVFYRLGHPARRAPPPDLAAAPTAETPTARATAQPKGDDAAAPATP